MTTTATGSHIPHAVEARALVLSAQRAHQRGDHHVAGLLHAEAEEQLGLAIKAMPADVRPSSLTSLRAGERTGPGETAVLAGTDSPWDTA